MDAYCEQRKVGSDLLRAGGNSRGRGRHRQVHDMRGQFFPLTNHTKASPRQARKSPGLSRLCRHRGNFNAFGTDDGLRGRAPVARHG